MVVVFIFCLLVLDLCEWVILYYHVLLLIIKHEETQLCKIILTFTKRSAENFLSIYIYFKYLQHYHKMIFVIHEQLFTNSILRTIEVLSKAREALKGLSKNIFGKPAHEKDIDNLGASRPLEDQSSYKQNAVDLSFIKFNSKVSTAYQKFATVSM